MHHKLTHQGHQEIHPDNEKASEIWMLLHTLQEIHKVNDEISVTRHDNLLKYVPIPKWYTKRRRGRLPGLRSSSKIEETEQAERFADGSVCKVPKLRNRMVVVNVDTTSSSLR